MLIFSYIMILLISLVHFYIMYLEMYQWTSKKSQKIFNTNEQLANQTIAMAGNQWLYNWFLASWLFISLIYFFNNAEIIWNIIAYIFLSFVFIAWIYWSITVKKKILYIQSLPAIIALVALYIS